MTPIVQALLTAVLCSVVMFVVIPLIIRRYPVADKVINMAPSVLETAETFAEALDGDPDNISPLEAWLSVAKKAVISIEQMKKVGEITNNENAHSAAVQLIKRMLELEGWEPEFIAEWNDVIDAAVRIAVSWMNTRGMFPPYDGAA